MPPVGSSKIQVGLFWGKEGIALVETADKRSMKSITLPFNIKLEPIDNQPIPDELKPTAILKRAVQEARIVHPKINLTLSTKDFIFRSFAIPFMSEKEAKNVIDFEATKYIPIPLQDLFYSYHTIPFSDNTQKNLRVLFFAARKDLLGRYVNFIEQAGFQVDHIEAEPVSLARLLLQQRRINPRQSTAVITLAKGEGKLTIIENGVVQFVREFQMPDQLDDAVLIRAKLFNEVRNSFNFYTRQNLQGKIEALLLLSAKPLLELDRDLHKEFNKPATCLTLKDFIPATTTTSGGEIIGFLPAFGNAIREKSLAPWDFELAEKARNLHLAGKVAQQQFYKYIRTAGVVLLCLLFGMGFSYLLKVQMTINPQKKITTLKEEIGIYQSLNPADLETMQASITTKLNSYNAIPLKSNVADLLRKIPNLLPEQAWLKEFNITYPSRLIQTEAADSKSSVTLSGYVYLPETNEQYRYVMNMVDTLKVNAQLTKEFQTITLDAMTQEVLNGKFTATGFRITCQ